MSAKNRFQVACSAEKCAILEDMEKARICRTCADEAKIELRVDDQTMAPYVFCSSCAIDSHIVKGHAIVKYLPWKNERVMEDSSGSGLQKVYSMVALCEDAYGSGKEQLEEWKQRIQKAQLVGNAADSARLCDDIATLVGTESDLVAAVADSLVGPLRRMCQEIEESKARIDLALGDNERLKELTDEAEAKVARLRNAVVDAHQDEAFEDVNEHNDSAAGGARGVGGDVGGH